MVKRFQTIKPEVMERWRVAAEIEGIVKEAYRPEIKIVEDSSGMSKYTFGLILNEHRFRRPGAVQEKESPNCNLCNAVALVNEEPLRDLSPDYKLLDFVVTLNKFPTVEGFSMAITREERPMFTASNLQGITEELSAVLDFADEKGFEVFHNSPGFGATIPQHEHWHLTSFRLGYDLLGKSYGFDAAELSSSRATSEVQLMPDFPFAHLVFKRQDPERIITFLEKVQSELGGKYEGGAVPHTISRGYNGILVMIGKKYLPRCIGSGDMAGHLPVKSREDFTSLDYESCIRKIEEVAFRKEEIDLERFL